jgi:hypothetical protein
MAPTSQPMFGTPRQIMGHEMVRSALRFALISTGMIGAALGLGAHNASAADDCITASNVVPPKGSRWHYDVDRATNRKCWHIVALSTASHTPNTQRTSARSAPGLTVRSKHQVSESGRAAVTQRTTVGIDGAAGRRSASPIRRLYSSNSCGGRSSRAPRTATPSSHRAGPSTHRVMFELLAGRKKRPAGMYSPIPRFMGRFNEHQVVQLRT